MSIRLRLTLLYSGILALTLIAFSTLLYVTQSQATYDAVSTTIGRQAQEFANRDRRISRRTDEPSAVVTLPGRWTQTRNADGTIIGRTADLSDTVLPLSDAGLHSVQAGDPWVETAQVDDEPLLIYNQPVVVQDRVVRIVQVAASISEREQSLNALRWILTIGSALVIVGAFAIGWMLSGMALRSIHRITQTAQAIGAERDFSRRVEHSGPNDEVGQLSVTFNAMLAELESAYRQVEQALDTQRRFVADASHELRTPLTTILGNLELLRHHPPVDAQDQEDILADTKDETERLIRLVNQLLVLARADAKRPLRRELIPIKPLVEDVCHQVRLLAPHRKIVCDAAHDMAVIADHDALKQVLLILLDNALVHTPPNASTSVTASRADGYVSIRIRDTGPGIAPERLAHIFERFYRGDASRSGKGTGLGLSIAKELVQAQNGDLLVESQVGRGSMFTVRLPQSAG